MSWVGLNRVREWASRSCSSKKEAKAGLVGGPALMASEATSLVIRTFDGLATDDRGHLRPGFLNRIGLRRQDLRIAFAVQNLELE